MCHNLWHIVFAMRSINIRQLRDTRKLKAWLKAGQTIELRERDHVIAKIVPQATSQHRAELPDFAAIRKEIFGDRILPGSDLLIQERGRF